MTWLWIAVPYMALGAMAGLGSLIDPDIRTREMWARNKPLLIALEAVTFVIVVVLWLPVTARPASGVQK